MGRRAEATARRGNTVTLRSGTYFADELFLEPQTVIEIDDNEGPVIVNVRTRLDYKADRRSAHGGFPKLMINYLGDASTTFPRPAIGTVLAPFAELILESGDNAVHQGAFVAKRLVVRPGATVRHVPFTWLIRTVTFSNDDPDDDEFFVGYAEVVVPPTDCPAGIPCDAEPDGVEVVVDLTGGNPRMREAVLSGQVWILADRRGSPGCITCSAASATPWVTCLGYCWPTRDSSFDGVVYPLNDEHPDSSGTVWQGCGGDRVKGKLGADLHLDTSTLEVYGELAGNLWRDRQCHEDGERSGPVVRALSVPADTTGPIPNIEIHQNENTVLFYNLALENRVVAGSLPIPPFADHTDVARTRRRVHVTGVLEVQDDDVITPDITEELSIDTNLDLDPWERKLKRTFSICAGNKIVGEVQLMAELHGDLETIDVAAKLVTKHGKALHGCNEPVTCGQDYVATGPVGPGQSAAIPVAEDDCREDPLAVTQYSSFARFKYGAVENLTWTP